MLDFAHMKLRFGSRFKGSRVLRFRFASDGIFDKVWIAGCHPCVSGILPRPDLHEAEVDSPRDPENRGWNPLTQKDEMEPGSFFLDQTNHFSRSETALISDSGYKAQSPFS